MLKNHLKVALRNLRKQAGYSLINVGGLGLGLACCVLILLFVQDERSFDRFHENADRIYRVVLDAQPSNAPPDRFALVSRPVGRVLRDDFPEVESVTRLNQWGPVVKHEGQYFFDDDFYFAEPAFFDIFSFPLLEGDPETALAEPNTLVLTEEMAAKYFGSGGALGQSITLDDSLQFTVTGVMANIPTNSTFTTDFLVSYPTALNFQPENDDEWLALGTYVYLTLNEGVSAAAFEQKISGLITENYGETLQSINLTAALRLQPLRDIYLLSDRSAEIGPIGSLATVYVFSLVALFVLLLACINFMNLATARSMERAKEVGVRKVVGSTRGMLIGQFLGESLLLCGVALVIAVGLIAAALPFFNDLAGKEIVFSTLLQPGYVLSLLGLTLAVGLLAGSYPALVLSSFPALSVLRGLFRSSKRGAGLRKGLVAFQFAVSVALIACTLIVFSQLRFMQNQDLGFDEEQVLVLNAQGLPADVMATQHETAKAEFLRQPAVLAASASNVVPGRGNWLQIFRAEGLAEEDSRRAQIVVVDPDYVETYGIEMLAGRSLSDAFETDLEEGVMINEAAVRNIGWGAPEDALGKTINLAGRERHVVGVIEDYHHHGLQEVIEPMILLSIPDVYAYFSLRIDTESAPATLAALEATWTRLFPGYTFDTFFLNADYNNQYEAEQRLTRLFGVFSFLAIFIACLGLFGLAAFMAQQRTKEIGVRKVLGATVPQIVVLLSKGFTVLVLVGMLVAAPVAYFAMEQWLDDFAYRIGIGPATFLLAGLLALVIAWLTVSYQAIRAATTNPVEALRYE